MIYDYKKLKGRIIEKYDTYGKFAEKLGISNVSLSKKLTCKTGFSQSDIDACAKLLDIPVSEYGEYFFA